MRFGFVDKTDGFAFTYEGRDNDRTIFPGEGLCMQSLFPVRMRRCQMKFRIECFSLLRDDAE